MGGAGLESGNKRREERIAFFADFRIRVFGNQHEFHAHSLDLSWQGMRLSVAHPTFAISEFFWAEVDILLGSEQERAIWAEVRHASLEREPFPRVVFGVWVPIRLPLVALTSSTYGGYSPGGGLRTLQCNTMPWISNCPQRWLG